MLNINGIINSIFSSKIDKKPTKSHKIQGGLTHDVFQRALPEITFINNHEGIPTLKLIKTSGIQEIQSLDGTKIYTAKKTLNGTNETVYSRKGKKLYELQSLCDGSVTKTIFDTNVNKVKSIIKYDKDGKVLSKKVVSPERPYIFSKEQEERIPKYLYHLTSVKNYQSMSNDGFIMTTSDKTLDKEGTRAVFLVDGQNCLNKWANISNGSELSYITRLLKFCDKDKNGSVFLLRIETDKLDKSKIRFRDQDEVLKSFAVFDLPKNEQNEYFTFNKLYEKINQDRKHKGLDIAEDIFLTETTKRLSLGTPIQELENMDTKPVEILYTDEIPFDAIQETKLIDTSVLTTMSYYDENAENISKELLKDFFNK